VATATFESISGPEPHPDLGDPNEKLVNALESGNSSTL
jgi:hypothetical protein